MMSEYNDIQISGSNTNLSYVICEFLINTILEHNEVDEIKYGNDKQKLQFIKWNHNYWKPNFR